MERRFRINEPSVVSETIDGEAVIVHLVTGNYFSTGGTGSLIWAWLGQAASPGSIAKALRDRYTVEETVAATAVDRFIGDLLAHELLCEWPDAPEPAVLGPGAESAPATRVEWVPPTLEVYQDMKDLLLLDPVHDVDEAGWPMPKQPDAPVT